MIFTRLKYTCETFWKPACAFWLSNCCKTSHSKTQWLKKIATSLLTILQMKNFGQALCGHMMSLESFLWLHLCLGLCCCQEAEVSRFSSTWPLPSTRESGPSYSRTRLHVCKSRSYQISPDLGLRVIQCHFCFILAQASQKFSLHSVGRGIHSKTLWKAQ